MATFAEGDAEYYLSDRDSTRALGIPGWSVPSSETLRRWAAWQLLIESYGKPKSGAYVLLRALCTAFPSLAVSNELLARVANWSARIGALWKTSRDYRLSLDLTAPEGAVVLGLDDAAFPDGDVWHEMAVVEKELFPLALDSLRPWIRLDIKDEAARIELEHRLAALIPSDVPSTGGVDASLGGFGGGVPASQLVHEVLEVARIYAPWLVLGRIAEKAVEAVIVEWAKQRFGPKAPNTRKRTVLLYGPDGKIDREIDVDR